MMRSRIPLLVAALAVALAAPSQGAVTIIDFEAVALRPANDGSGDYGTITEWPAENGVTAEIPKAGQKVYYGTDYFNGWALSNVDYIEFTYKRANGGNNPYTNAVITDGSANYGVISSQGGSTIWEIVGPTHTEKRMRYYYAGDSGNQAYGFRFYEPSPDDGSWPHGTNIVWSDIQSWDMLGVAVQRPLYSGESGVPRGPVDHGLVILWGDSQDNYLGNRDIYDVVVSTGGEEYFAGIPEPAAIVVWSLLGACGLVLTWRRRRAA